MKAAPAAILFYAGWIACVAGAGVGLFWAGPLVAGLVCGLHAGLAADRRAALRLLVRATLLGVAVETLLQAADIVAYAGRLPRLPFAPAWILALWPLLALTIRPALGFLIGRPLRAAVLGAIGGAASYAGGERLGAVSFPHGAGLGLGAVALLWLGAMPLLGRLAAIDEGRDG